MHTILPQSLWETMGPDLNQNTSAKHHARMFNAKCVWHSEKTYAICSGVHMHRMPSESVILVLAVAALSLLSGCQLEVDSVDYVVGLSSTWEAWPLASARLSQAGRQWSAAYS